MKLKKTMISLFSCFLLTSCNGYHAYANCTNLATDLTIVVSVKAFKEMGQDTKKMLSTFDSITDSISEIATSFDDIGESTFLIMDNTKTLQKQIAKVSKSLAAEYLSALKDAIPAASEAYAAAPAKFV